MFACAQQRIHIQTHDTAASSQTSLGEGIRFPVRVGNAAAVQNSSLASVCAAVLWPLSRFDGALLASVLRPLAGFLAQLQGSTAAD